MSSNNYAINANFRKLITYDHFLKFRSMPRPSIAWFRSLQDCSNDPFHIVSEAETQGVVHLF